MGRNLVKFKKLLMMSSLISKVSRRNHHFDVMTAKKSGKSSLFLCFWID